MVKFDAVRPPAGSKPFNSAKAEEPADEGEDQDRMVMSVDAVEAAMQAAEDL